MSPTEGRTRIAVNFWRPGSRIVLVNNPPTSLSSRRAALPVLALLVAASCSPTSTGSEAQASQACAQSVAPPSRPFACGRLTDDQGLNAGEWIKSCDGRFKLELKRDGNLLLSSFGVTLWQTKTWNQGGRFLVL